MMELIPAIDLIGGTCVRLYQGDYGQKRRYGDPYAIAKMYEEAGLRRLHLVDLDGAKEEKSKNLASLERIAKGTTLAIDFGGGIKSRESLVAAYDHGASMVTCGSIAVEDRAQVLAWKQEFGEDRLIIGCDCKEGFVATRGWQELSRIKVEDLMAFYWNNGFKKFICTDISRDGTLSGPSFTLYRSLLAKFPGVGLVASGGVKDEEDIRELSDEGLTGVIIGKALLEGRVRLSWLSHWGK